MVVLLLHRGRSTANWHSRCCSEQLSPRIPPGIPRQAQRAIHQLSLNILITTSSYQAFIGQIPSQMCPHCGSEEKTVKHRLFSAQSGQQNDNSTSVTPSSYQMCSSIVSTWWNSSSLRGICPHINSAWGARYANNNKVSTVNRLV